MLVNKEQVDEALDEIEMEYNDDADAFSVIQRCREALDALPAFDPLADAQN